METDESDALYVYLPFASTVLIALCGFLTQLCCTRVAPKSEKHGETAQKQVTIMV